MDGNVVGNKEEERMMYVEGEREKDREGERRREGEREKPPRWK